jgi:tetratricopeptide (TPR) repeat protein
MQVLEPGVAAAQRRGKPAVSDFDAAAKRKFEEAQAQYGLTNFVEAARLYAEAYRLRPARTTLLLYVGDAYKRDWEAQKAQASLKKAIEFFQRYLELAPAGADLSRARRELASLEPQLAEQERLARRRRLETAQGAAAFDLLGQLVRERDHEGAELILARVRSEPGRSRNELVSLLRLEARLAAEKGETERSIRAWRGALALEPRLAMPDAMPDTAEPGSATLAAAQRAAAGQPPLSAQHTPAGAIRRGEAALVRVQIDADPLAMVKKAQVAFRTRGAGAWAEARFAVTPKMELRIPEEFVASLEVGARVEYHVRLLGDHDAVLFEFGGSEKPFDFVIRDVELKPLTSGVVSPRDASDDAMRSSPLRTAGWATLAGGGALLTLGAVTLGMGKSLEGDLDKACPPPDRICGSQDARNDNGRYESLRTWWRIGLIGGGVGAAAGATMLWLAPKPSSSAGMRVTPFLGLASGGISGVF